MRPPTRNDGGAPSLRKHRFNQHEVLAQTTTLPITTTTTTLADAVAASADDECQNSNLKQRRPCVLNSESDNYLCYKSLHHNEREVNYNSNSNVKRSESIYENVSNNYHKPVSDFLVDTTTINNKVNLLLDDSANVLLCHQNANAVVNKDCLKNANILQSNVGLKEDRENFSSASGSSCSTSSNSNYSSSTSTNSNTILVNSINFENLENFHQFSNENFVPKNKVTKRFSSEPHNYSDYVYGGLSEVSNHKTISDNLAATVPLLSKNDQQNPITLVKNSASLIFTRKDISPIVHRRRDPQSVSAREHRRSLQLNSNSDSASCTQNNSERKQQAYSWYAPLYTTLEEEIEQESRVSKFFFALPSHLNFFW